MKTVVCPPIAASQRLHNHQRSVELQGPFSSPLKAEVPGGPPIGDHPVEDEVAGMVDRGVIGFPNTYVWYGIQRAS